MHPHITEKSALRAEDPKHPVFAFRVHEKVNKDEVARAVKALYKVTPIKVAMVRVQSKAVIYRNKRGVRSGFKKALVYLKAGDKIAFA